MAKRGGVDYGHNLKAALHAGESGSSSSSSGSSSSNNKAHMVEMTEAERVANQKILTTSEREAIQAQKDKVKAAAIAADAEANARLQSAVESGQVESAKEALRTVARANANAASIERAYEAGAMAEPTNTSIIPEKDMHWTEAQTSSPQPSNEPYTPELPRLNVPPGTTRASLVPSVNTQTNLPKPDMGKKAQLEAQQAQTRATLELLRREIESGRTTLDSYPIEDNQFQGTEAEYARYVDVHAEYEKDIAEYNRLVDQNNILKNDIRRSSYFGLAGMLEDSNKFYADRLPDYETLVKKAHLETNSNNRVLNDLNAFAKGAYEQVAEHPIETVGTVGLGLVTAGSFALGGKVASGVVGSSLSAGTKKTASNLIGLGLGSLYVGTEYKAIAAPVETEEGVRAPTETEMFERAGGAGVRAGALVTGFKLYTKTGGELPFSIARSNKDQTLLFKKSDVYMSEPKPDFLETLPSTRLRNQNTPRVFTTGEGAYKDVYLEIPKGKETKFLREYPTGEFKNIRSGKESFLSFEPMESTGKQNTLASISKKIPTRAYPKLMATNGRKMPSIPSIAGYRAEKKIPLREVYLSMQRLKDVPKIPEFAASRTINTKSEWLGYEPQKTTVSETFKQRSFEARTDMRRMMRDTAAKMDYSGLGQAGTQPKTKLKDKTTIKTFNERIYPKMDIEPIGNTRVAGRRGSKRSVDDIMKSGYKDVAKEMRITATPKNIGKPLKKPGSKGSMFGASSLFGRSPFTGKMPMAMNAIGKAPFKAPGQEIYTPIMPKLNPLGSSKSLPSTKAMESTATLAKSSTKNIRVAGMKSGVRVPTLPPLISLNSNGGKVKRRNIRTKKYDWYIENPIASPFASIKTPKKTKRSKKK
ncbi:MAG: hypothetical protein JXA38_04095 [Methanosarcinaceae archaeon]|nr:hypothetical protein [Methanosarcinaceae archaeon]